METVQTLWVLFYRMSKDADTLRLFYARNKEHAEQQASELLAEHPYERIDLKAYPHGFVIHHTCIPGRIEGHEEAR